MLPILDEHYNTACRAKQAGQTRTGLDPGPDDKPVANSMAQHC